jgi:hypothetical protein
MGRPKRHVGDDLELLRLLMRGPVQGSSREHAHVVRVPVELHQLVDEPRGRRRPSVPVLVGNDHDEAPSRNDHSCLRSQPAHRVLDRDLRGAESNHRFLSAEDVSAAGL